jgi:cytochrome c oxidase assembly protein subunit 15
MNKHALRSAKPVAIWIFVGVAMLMIQVVLGGITRLTGSGLSITEWKPILGAFPPLNEHDWQVAFDKYKQIGQYKQINFHFTLNDFKFIYFWEWFHRVWARLIAVAFVIPFILFVIQKRFRRQMILPMIILFLLGGLQGALGWIMVKSGLNEENIYVSHFRLAIHFIAAMVLVCYAFWFGLKLTVPSSQLVVKPGLRKFAIAIIGVLVLQLIYGAFMAGLKAAVAAPTWPTINGSWWPKEIGSDIFNDLINIQFIHRGLAYLITIIILIWWWKARSVLQGEWFKRIRSLPLLLVLLQVVLGILTVLHSTKPDYLLWLGVTHQFVAMLLLLSWIMMVYLLRSKSFAQLP